MLYYTIVLLLLLVLSQLSQLSIIQFIAETGAADQSLLSSILDEKGLLLVQLSCWLQLPATQEEPHPYSTIMTTQQNHVYVMGYGDADILATAMETETASSYSYDETVMLRCPRSLPQQLSKSSLFLLPQLFFSCCNLPTTATFFLSAACLDNC